MLVYIAPIAVMSEQPVEARPEPEISWGSFDRIIAERLERDRVAGVVVVLIIGGEPTPARAFGLAAPASGRAMDLNATFRVESLSKPVVAWGLMALAEAGRLDLDAPIADCLRRWTPPREAGRITLRQLLSHSSGLGLGDFTARYPPDAARPSLDEQIATEFQMITAPGARFAYSDTGYNLIELVVEDCTGEGFGDLMQRVVLQPLGMQGASFERIDAVMPVGHDLRGNPVDPYVYPGRASGGLLATAADIGRFAAASMTGADQPVLSSEGIDDLHDPLRAVHGTFAFAADGYGLGHFTETLSDGRNAVWHGGQGYGWMSHLHLVPETGDGIVILSNSQRAWPLFAAILRRWSEGIGVAPVGMAGVLWAETAARIAIAMLLIAASGAIWRLGRRPIGGATRAMALVVAAPLVIWPLWVANQDWLFLFSILPSLWPWLTVSTGAAGLAFFAMALLSRRAGNACG